MSDKENISTEDKESTSTSSLSWYPIEDFVECMHEDPGVEGNLFTNSSYCENDSLKQHTL